jgi:hypothetical protein
MGLLAGQEQIINDGDTIAIKMHMFDIMADHVMKLMRGNIYSTHELERQMHDRICVCKIRDLYVHFMLSVDDIEQICKSPAVRLIQEDHIVVADSSAEIKASLENVLHLYRNELDQIPVVIHKNPIFIDTKHDLIKTISLKEYIRKHKYEHVQFIQKTLTEAYVKFSDEFIEEAIEYLSKKLCKN